MICLTFDTDHMRSEYLEEFLGNLVDSIDQWQGQLISPLEEALTEREVIRQQITNYKDREGLA